MLKKLKMKNKLLFFGGVSASLPVRFTLLAAVSSVTEMNRLASRESESLVQSDLDHIVLGIKNMCKAHHDLAGQMLHNTLNTARGVRKRGDPFQSRFPGRVERREPVHA